MFKFVFIPLLIWYISSFHIPFVSLNVLVYVGAIYKGFYIYIYIYIYIPKTLKMLLDTS